MRFGWSSIRAADFLVCCVLEVRCGSAGVVPGLQASWFVVCWRLGAVWLE